MILSLAKRIKKYLVEYVHRDSTTRFQIGIQLLTLVVVVLLGQNSLRVNVLHIADPKPLLYYFSPAEREKTSNSAIAVKCGCYIKDFPTFEAVKNHFVVDAIVWFEVDAYSISVELIDKFSFKRGTIISKSAPDTTIIKDKLFVSYNVRIDFSSNLNYRYFPFNDHRIALILTNEFVTPKELIYVGYDSGVGIAPQIYTGGWVEVKSDVDYGYTSVKVEEDSTTTVNRPAIMFSFYYSQTGVKNVFLILVPMLLMYYMAFFTLSLSVEHYAQLVMTLSVGSMTALLAYRFVIEQLSPSVSYFVISDYLYLYILSALFLVLLLDLFSIRSVRLSFNLKLARILLSVVSNIFLVGLLYYLLNIWGHG